MILYLGTCSSLCLRAITAIIPSEKEEAGTFTDPDRTLYTFVSISLWAGYHARHCEQNGRNSDLTKFSLVEKKNIREIIY